MVQWSNLFRRKCKYYTNSFSCKSILSSSWLHWLTKCVSIRFNNILLLNYTIFWRTLHRLLWSIFLVLKVALSWSRRPTMSRSLFPLLRLCPSCNNNSSNKRNVKTSKILICPNLNSSCNFTHRGNLRGPKFYHK